MKLIKDTSSKNTDATVEVAIRLGVDPVRQIRWFEGTVNLPHGTGKTAKVIVFAVGDKGRRGPGRRRRRGGRRGSDREDPGRLARFRRRDRHPDQMARSAGSRVSWARAA